MSISQRLFTDALRDMQRAMTVFEQPFFSATPRHSLLGGTFFHDNNGSEFGNQILTSSYPATDMIETPEHYELHAELPGYDKSNIKIELADNHTLVLSGSIKKQLESKSVEPDTDTDIENQSDKEKKQLATTQTRDNQVNIFNEEGRQWWVKERISGSFTRSFSFPSPIKADNIKASYENGILKVIVPKTIENNPKIINIE
ncbi:HSP20-like chaperone [Cokeromyces recurvatus]|uniref:HSP20-like chaperone n=1 Tax=Cokeromyces recurvatus TaxID=90255 RepID=UPI00222028F0|nr:HSP20-like chaperone [Cokeromyces recurvatus]KAI7898351.1 HSP20-like chaperone [Cokeromyces recurvatus]